MEEQLWETEPEDGNEEEKTMSRGRRALLRWAILNHRVSAAAVLILLGGGGAFAILTPDQLLWQRVVIFSLLGLFPALVAYAYGQAAYWLLFVFSCIYEPIAGIVTPAIDGLVSYVKPRAARATLWSARSGVATARFGARATVATVRGSLVTANFFGRATKFTLEGIVAAARIAARSIAIAGRAVGAAARSVGTAARLAAGHLARLRALMGFRVRHAVG